MNIEDIKDPKFLKSLSVKELEQLSKDIRAYILEAVSQNGGHLSSNLGIVELVVAMHYAFDAPEDKFIFDVGHQTYTHKILTGRAKELKESLRKLDGISGYQKLSESIYDQVEAGHSSTSLSLANGFALARDLNKEKHNVVAFIGDASIVSGLALEALNNLGNQKNKVIIIFNDNEMSISKPTGGINKVLNRIRSSSKYQNSKEHLKNHLKGNKFRVFIFKITSRFKYIFKSIFVKSNIFEDLNLEYLGPYDGYDIKSLIKVFNASKKLKKSVVIHVSTKKGKGYEYSENDDEGIWHGVGPFDIKSGKPLDKDTKVSFSQLMADKIHQKMAKDENIVTITPAMIQGSKLQKIFKDYKERAIDVGISEEHALTLASGLALQKKVPFVSIYSTFMQRAYDNLNHDCARMNLKMVIGVDRAGIVGEDGDTHQGIYDVEITKGLPSSVIAMPLDNADLQNIVDLAFNEDKLFFIRYPRLALDPNDNYEFEPLTIGKWDILKRSSSKTLIISLGPVSKDVHYYLNEHNLDVNLVFARFYKPLDYKLLDELLPTIDKIIVYDIYATKNGIYQDILEYINEHDYQIKVLKLTLPNANITYGKIEEIYKLLNLTIDDLAKLI